MIKRNICSGYIIIFSEKSEKEALVILDEENKQQIFKKSEENNLLKAKFDDLEQKNVSLKTEHKQVSIFKL